MAMAMPCAPKVIMEQLCAPSCLRGLQAATIFACHRHVSKDTHGCRHHKKALLHHCKLQREEFQARVISFELFQQFLGLTVHSTTVLRCLEKLCQHRLCLFLVVVFQIGDGKVPTYVRRFVGVVVIGLHDRQLPKHRQPPGGLVQVFALLHIRIKGLEVLRHIGTGHPREGACSLTKTEPYSSPSFATWRYS